MYSVLIDKDRKILFLTIEDSISHNESVRMAQEFWVKQATLGRGAIIVNDIRQFKNGTRISRVLLQKMMKLIEAYKPQVVFRIVNGYSGAMQFDRAYTNIKAKYRVVRVATKERAMNLIAEEKLMSPVIKDIPSTN